VLGLSPSPGGFPERPAEISHDLPEDARLTVEAVAALADRLPRKSVICDTAAQPLLVPQGGPPRGVLARPGDVIRNLADANAWLTLLNIEDDPAYADLTNTMLDQVQPAMIAQGGMRKRVGFIFVSSPDSVTPAHFDIEHSLLMQVSGAKTVSIGRFESDQTKRHEVERYWDGSHGRVEGMPTEVASYSLTPGRGVYIPPVVPHWVHNGPAISLSVTLTYFTGATDQQNLIEACNARLRRMHLNPRQPGESTAADLTKIVAMRGRALARQVSSRVRHRNAAAEP
jgi:hypothetical protein